MSEKTASNEEVIKHKQFIQEISHQLKQKETEATKKIKEKMDSIPDVLDSKQRFLQD